MITNEKQYRSTRTEAERLRAALGVLDDPSTPSHVHPVLQAAQRSGLLSQLEELDGTLREYEQLRAGEITILEASGLEELPDILIRARIARGMSQRDLAEFLGLKEQQIQRYEADRYRSASLERLGEVSDALGIKLNERAELIGDGSLGAVNLDAPSAFPFSEMYRRGYFEDFEGSGAQARAAAADLLPAFFDAARRPFAAALHRKTIRANGKLNEAAVAAWEARVIQLSRRNPPKLPFDPDRLTAEWVAVLTGLSRAEDGPKRAIEHLRTAGVGLVVEPHLPGTHLDGAALADGAGWAVVAMTLRHDRLDNFWFTLLHEVGHLRLHLGREPGYKAIFDDTESAARDPREDQADSFAQEALLPQDLWRACLSRFSRSERAVLADAAKFSIHPAIIAGRIRREAGDYTLLRGLVGSGDVRRQLLEQG